MALLTFNGLDGNEVHINPTLIEAVTTFNWFDHDLELPAEMYHQVEAGREVRPDKREEADALRTSPRTIITTSNGTFIVNESQADVLKAVNGK